MRIKRTGRRGRHAHPPESGGSTVEELAAQLAPPEEQAKAAAAQGNEIHHGGSIVVDGSAIKMPEGFGAGSHESRFEIGRVVVVVTLLMLLFTAFIAWQITRMPDGDEPQPVRVVPSEQ
jgi:hypothetical protein